MISKALDYAKQMRGLNIASDVVDQANDIFTAVPQVKLDFENPGVAVSAKHHVIDKVFPHQIRDLLKVLCDNGDVELWDQILEAYKNSSPERKDEFVVTLSYVTEPTEEQLAGIKDYVIKKYKREDMIFEKKKDESLGGGFVIQAGNDMIDWSTKGRLKQFEDQLDNVKKNLSASSKGIISILKSEIEEFKVPPRRWRWVLSAG